MYRFGVWSLLNPFKTENSQKSLPPSRLSIFTTNIYIFGDLLNIGDSGFPYISFLFAVETCKYPTGRVNNAFSKARAFCVYRYSCFKISLLNIFGKMICFLSNFNEAFGVSMDKLHMWPRERLGKIPRTWLVQKMVDNGED